MRTDDKRDRYHLLQPCQTPKRRRQREAMASTSRPDSLLDRLCTHATKWPEKQAIAFLSSKGEIEQKLTYQELEQQTDALASALLSKGLAPGERAVLVYPPSLEFTVAFLACLKAGITAVPVFPPNPLRRDSLNMFTVIVKACAATHALTDSSYNHQKKLASIRDAIPKFKRKPLAAWPETLEWIVTSDIKNGSNRPSKKSTSEKNARSSSSSSKTNNLAFLQFTSGSTSDPKGVMITHDNLAHNLSIITRELRAVDDTVVVSWLPQYHDMGLIGSYLGCLYCGGTGYFLSPLTFLQRPRLWMECAARYGATHLQAPNFAFKLTARKFKDGDDEHRKNDGNPKTNDPPKLDLSSVRHVINAAEPVDEESMKVFYETFGPFGFRQVIYPTYGLAEHTVFVCSGGKQIITVKKKELEVDGNVVLAHSDDGDKEVSKMVGCGYPSRQGVNVVIVNPESCESVIENTVGEIWISSPSKAAGYFQKPEETKHDFHAKLRTEAEDSDGFLRSGDLGFMHNDELFICGRLKDLIIVGGRNYYPQDIEATAESSSDLVRPGCSAAFTIDPTHEGGEEVALVMELKEVPASQKNIEQVCVPLAKEIRSAINQEHSLGISSVAFLKTRTVPKTSSGKIARAWCRKGYVAKTLQVVYEMSFKQSADPAPLEIDQATGTQQPSTARDQSTSVGKKDAATIRAMSKEDILKSLVTDISRVGSIPEASIEKNVALITMLDSLTISQFKGLLENNYHINISDEYLFRESTTVNKLVEVAKLGYAPDDADGENAAAMVAGPGNDGGLAGCLGCPPGVVCIIL